MVMASTIDNDIHWLGLQLKIMLSEKDNSAFEFAFVGNNGRMLKTPVLYHSNVIKFGRVSIDCWSIQNSFVRIVNPMQKWIRCTFYVGKKKHK